MGLTELIEKHDTIHQNLLVRLGDEVSDIRSLADTMAECATNMHGHGYVSFINAREEFMKAMDKFKDDMRKIIFPTQ